MTCTAHIYCRKQWKLHDAFCVELKIEIIKIGWGKKLKLFLIESKVIPLKWIKWHSWEKLPPLLIRKKKIHKGLTRINLSSNVISLSKYAVLCCIKRAINEITWADLITHYTSSVVKASKHCKWVCSIEKRRRCVGCGSEKNFNSL